MNVTRVLALCCTTVAAAQARSRSQVTQADSSRAAHKVDLRAVQAPRYDPMSCTYTLAHRRPELQRGPSPLRPVIINQIVQADQAHPDAEFFVEQTEVKDVSRQLARHQETSYTHAYRRVEAPSSLDAVSDDGLATASAQSHFTTTTICTSSCELKLTRLAGRSPGYVCRLRAITEQVGDKYRLPDRRWNGYAWKLTRNACLRLTR